MMTPLTTPAQAGGAAPATPPQDAAARSRAMRMLLVAERGRLLRFIERTFPRSLSPAVEPDDVLNDTCFDALRQIDAFVPTDESSVYRLLATIARRRMAQLLRVQGRVKRGGRSKHVGQSDSVVAGLAELAAHERTPSRSAARHEFVAALQDALARLPEDLRVAVTLRHVDGLTPGEAAVRMGRTERAARQLCYRGVQLVRRALRTASRFA